MIFCTFETFYHFGFSFQSQRASVACGVHAFHFWAFSFPLPFSFFCVLPVVKVPGFWLCWFFCCLCSPVVFVFIFCLLVVYFTYCLPPLSADLRLNTYPRLTPLVLPSSSVNAPAVLHSQRTQFFFCCHFVFFLVHLELQCHTAYLAIPFL